MDQKIKSLLLYQLSYGGKEESRNLAVPQDLASGGLTVAKRKLPWTSGSIQPLPRGVTVTQKTLDLLFKVQILAG